MNEIAQIWQYTDLDDFKKTSNNFYLTFTLGWMGETVYRNQNAFKRFKSKYPDFERQLTEKVCLAINQPPPFTESLPWDDLLNAYKMMAELVYKSDPYVMDDKGNVNKRILCQ